MLVGIIGEDLDRNYTDFVNRILRVTVLHGFTSLAIIVSEFNHQSDRLEKYKYRCLVQLGSRHFTNLLTRTLVDSTFIMCVVKILT